MIDNDGKHDHKDGDKFFVDIKKSLKNHKW